MHPIEHLRYVARAGGDPAALAREAAWALAEVASDDPAGLVPACRRLVERHLSAGPVWWLSARVLGSEDPACAAEEAAGLLSGDPTRGYLADAIPDDATTLLVGSGALMRRTLRSRGDVEVLVLGEDVPPEGVGAAAACVDVVLVEGHAAGPSGLLGPPGGLAAAAVAAHLGVPVWGALGVGRTLPGRLWDALLARLDEAGHEPWDRDVELVPASLVSAVVGPDGLVEPDAGFAAATCPAAPELLRPAG